MNSTMDDVSVVSSTAERIKSDALQSFPEAASFGDTFRQGDVYITLIEAVPAGSQILKAVPKQLAPGKTQGSRHCLKSTRGVKAYALKEPNAYDGPVIELTKPNVITHPEHGDVSLPCGIYAISFQRTEDSEGRQRRVQD